MNDISLAYKATGDIFTAHSQQTATKKQVIPFTPAPHAPFMEKHWCEASFVMLQKVARKDFYTMSASGAGVSWCGLLSSSSGSS